MSLDTIATAIVEINERNLVIASAAEEQAQVAREVDRNLVNIATCRCSRPPARSDQRGERAVAPGGGPERDGRTVSPDPL
jgi:hypothetical protein